MSMLRFAPRSRSEVPINSFSSAEEAWFWFVRCQAGAPRRRSAERRCRRLSRPCDPDDIYCAIIGLQRRGVISGAHLAVLGHFGLLGRAPDARCAEEAVAAQRWAEALDRLATVLRAKGIVG
ncbi:MAG: hypothetical protein U1E33_03300 [Rhodospirillales bacterium]